MAATIATARGIDSTRVKETHRLGSTASEATVATYQTFVYSRVQGDGSWSVTVRQNGRTVHEATGGPE